MNGPVLNDAILLAHEYGHFHSWMQCHKVTTKEYADFVQIIEVTRHDGNWCAFAWRGKTVKSENPKASDPETARSGGGATRRRASSTGTRPGAMGFPSRYFPSRMSSVTVVDAIYGRPTRRDLKGLPAGRGSGPVGASLWLGATDPGHVVHEGNRGAGQS